MHEFANQSWDQLSKSFEQFLCETKEEAAIIKWNQQLEEFIVIGSPILKLAISTKDLNAIKYRLIDLQNSTLQQNEAQGIENHEAFKRSDYEKERAEPDHHDNCEKKEVGSSPRSAPESSVSDRNEAGFEDANKGKSTLQENCETFNPMATRQDKRNCESNIKTAMVSIIKISLQQLGKKGDSTKKKGKFKKDSSGKECPVCGKVIYTNLKNHMEKHDCGDRPFVCGHCGRLFEFEHNYKVHVRSHDPKRERACKTCGEEFYDLKDIRLHNAKMHVKNHFECSFCGKVIKRRENLVDHEIRHVKSLEQEYLICDLCGLNCPTENELKEHMKSHNAKGEEFNCGDCGKRFSLKQEYIEHVAESHGTSSILECIYCPEKFTCKVERVNHYRLNHYKKRHICKICGKSFRGQYEMQAHTNNHVGSKPHKCDSCNKCYTNPRSLKRHKKTHGNPEERAPFMCEVCGKRFTGRRNQQIHAKIHTGELPFPCTICKRPFRTKTSLKLHMIQHTGNRQYVCDLCGREFARNRRLQEHIKTHTEAKSFQCHLCSQAFHTSWALKKHETVHTGEKSFTCSVCGRGFKYDYNLNVHMRTHAGSAFNCKLCSKSFSTERGLLLHAFSHNAPEMGTNQNSTPDQYVCKVCYTQFRNDFELATHTASHLTPMNKLSVSQSGVMYPKEIDVMLGRQMWLHNA